MNKEVDTEQAQKVCNTFNSLTHGDPMSSTFNLVSLPTGGFGYSVGKVLNEPTSVILFVFNRIFT